MAGRDESNGSVGRRGWPVVCEMSRSKLVASLSTLVFFSGWAACSVAEAAHLPLSPVYLGASYANDGLQVEPATITYTGDGTGLIGGASARRGGITWFRWTSATAVGSGFNQLDDCVPSCAAGGYAVRIQMWRPRTVDGILVFTRLTIFYPHGHPRGEGSHYTFTDIYRQGYGFAWSPPDAEGYCTNTQGMPPAAGCSNVNSLP
jgi:hypothetical protein